ncbi:serine O-acetyltransferase [Granulicoccus sp. GXG6511]|uniref:serine O-acetyltransferase n=1 Tax=Granulicoccus sp. GXG6511 TaxID=3381351 RepID=UPI003D7DCCD0
MRDLLAADFPRCYQPFQRITVSIWRAGQVLRYSRGPVCWVLRRIVLIADLIWVQTLMGAELPHEVWAGPGVRLEHGGRGIILHPSVSIGSGVTIYHHVTMGVKDNRDGPVVGDDVLIGVGARLLGPIKIGDRCRIGANAVVTRDTEPDSTYLGIPARKVEENRTSRR